MPPQYSQTGLLELAGVEHSAEQAGLLAPMPREPDTRINLEDELGPPRTPSLRLLKLPAREYESPWKRWLYLLVALTIAAGYLYLLLGFFAPASPGVDQNGYLVGGKMLAKTGSTGFRQTDPYQFVGYMWNLVGEPTATGAWYYPKYPIGLPLLNAILLWINWDHGKVWALYLSPVCASLSLLAVFMLVRQLAGSFMGLLAMLLLGVNYVSLTLSEMPWSHAPALLFVTSGVWMLVRWWQTGSAWRGALAGFLLGYAVTIRYSEGLLLLPMFCAVLCAMRWRALINLWLWRPIVAFALLAGANWMRLRGHNDHVVSWAIVGAVLTLASLLPYLTWRSGLSIRAIVASLFVGTLIYFRIPREWTSHYDRDALLIFGAAALFLLLYLYAPCVVRRGWIPIFGWLIPILWLIGFNYFAMGSITGYDTTNESTGFSVHQLHDQWEYMVEQLYDYGGFVILPLTLLGLIVMWRWSWRLTLMLTLWVLPVCLLYGAYYWGNNLPGVSYLRFFHTVIPGLVIPAVWFLRHGGWWRAEFPERSGSVALPVACGALVAVATGFGLRNAISSMEREQVTNVNLDFTVKEIKRVVPAGSLVFADQRMAMYGLLNFLQWAGDYTLYASDAFDSGPRQWGGNDPERPHPMQSARTQARASLYKTLTDKDLVTMQNKLMRDAIANSHPQRVFAVLPNNWVNIFNTRFIHSSTQFEWKKVSQWSEPAVPLPEPTITPLMPRSRGFSLGRAQTTWEVFEIKLKPVPATTTTAPTTITQSAK